MANLERLDKRLVELKLAATRTQAQRMIETGRVELHQGGVWSLASKAGMKLAEGTELRVQPSEDDQFVSRGALKLRGALQYTGTDPSGCIALDVGQSTGGFTDCLLQGGATKVVGVDVGHDQLAPALRADPRVVFYEGVNARALPKAALLELAPDGFDLIVMDVSFISQTLILPELVSLLKSGNPGQSGGQLLSLVKPQFEVGKAGIGKGGIVRDERLYLEVEARMRAASEALGLTVCDYFPSPITGGDGNREFFISAYRR